ncbi:GGDEF domain-containing protein, partial [Vibrio cholerae]|uniref:GGDEF domain-containing protein n=1 Tax=Vibrio cholerae TaxID=666 RepID=UPI000A606AD2
GSGDRNKPKRAIAITEIRSLEIGVSIGVALYPEQATQVPELLRIADEAMYTAKHQSGNTVYCAHQDKHDQTSLVS